MIWASINFQKNHHIFHLCIVLFCIISRITKRLTGNARFTFSILHFLPVFVLLSGSFFRLCSSIELQMNRMVIWRRWKRNPAPLSRSNSRQNDVLRIITSRAEAKRTRKRVKKEEYQDRREHLLSSYRKHKGNIEELNWRMGKAQHHSCRAVPPAGELSGGSFARVPEGHLVFLGPGGRESYFLSSPESFFDKGRREE